MHLPAPRQFDWHVGVGTTTNFGYKGTKHRRERILRSRSLLIAAAFALGIAVPANAHHTHAMYEPEGLVTLEGTVKETQWINPHSWLYLLVTNEAGETEEWALEGRAPFRLGEQGWDLDAIQAGDEITVTVRPLRGGAHGGLFGIVRLSDGREFVDEL